MSEMSPTNPKLLGLTARALVLRVKTALEGLDTQLQHVCYAAYSRSNKCFVPWLW